jgi:probable HAF family extracellular repeat protein
MTEKKLASVLAGVALTLCSAAQAKGHAMFAYDIGTPSVPECAPTAINDAGRVICSCGLSGVEHGFITGPNGAGLEDIGTLGSSIWPRAINAKGQIAGNYLAVPTNTYRAFITSADGKGLRDLGAPQLNSVANGINESGQVVGYVSTASGVQAFITGPNGAGMNLIETADGSSSFANAVNRSGQVAGGFYNNEADWITYAFITGPNGVGMTTLVLPPDVAGASAGAINDMGEIAGSLTMTAGSRFTSEFVTGPDGVGLTDLGALKGEQGFTNSGGEALNTEGMVVGFSFGSLSGRPYQATVTDGKNHLVNLNHWVVNLPPGVTLVNAVGINASGQIAAVGNDFHGYIVCPRENCAPK